MSAPGSKFEQPATQSLKTTTPLRREYSTALRLELARKEVKDDPNRTAELAAYFTHAKLQPVHQCLSLRSAMFIFFKMKNFATTATFCRRLLELNPPAKVLPSLQNQPPLHAQTSLHS